MTAAGPQAPADAEVCRGCSHGRGSHKRGKGGCREVDCACSRYEVDQRAQRTELNAALATQIEETQEVAAELAEERREHQATALRLEQAYERVDELTVELDRYAEILREAAKVLHVGADDEGDNYGEIPIEAAIAMRARWSVEERARTLTVERNEERTANAALHRQLAEQEQHAARKCGALAAENMRLRTELTRVEGVRDDARVALRNTATAYLATTTAAAGEVVSRYAAYLCLACSARYGKPYTDHGCGPLVPVVVTIARADRPGPDISKETAR